MALFKNEDALILGMLFARFFPAYIYKLNYGQPEIDGWSGGFGGGYIPDGWDPDGDYSTGRGGIARDINDKIAVYGDNGRPGCSDSMTMPAKPSLAGNGGQLLFGGAGLEKGINLFGGNASITIPTTSAGGGGGLFGGGSAFVSAGGGGGSSWVYSDNDYGYEGIQAMLDMYLNYDFPYWMTKPVWIGVDNSTLTYFNRNKPLFIENTYHEQEYIDSGVKSELGKAYEAYKVLRGTANGNGLVLISTPDNLIEINKNTGTIDNIGKIIELTGACEAWTPINSGVYQFILWGAQGGSAFYTPTHNEQIPGQAYTGGFGGCVSFYMYIQGEHTEIIDNESVEVLSTLYFRVGQRGNFIRGFKSFNGGGSGDNASSGGGATSVSWYDIDGDTSTGGAFRRYIFGIAGGGGGCIGCGPNGPNLPVTPGGGGDDDDGIVKPMGDEQIGFMVNDNSLVVVTLKYKSTAIIPDNSHAVCILYINDGKEGVLAEEFKIDPVGGTIELKYRLNKIYPPNTLTHWVTLNVEIRTNTTFIIPYGGVNIRVETYKAVNEEEVELFIPVVLRVMDRVRLLDFVDITFKGLPEDIIISNIDNMTLYDTLLYYEKNVINEYITMIDTLNISDSVKIILKAVEELYITVMDNIYGIDFYKVKLGDDPLEDIEINVLDNFNLVDIFYSLLIKDVSPDTFNIDNIGLNDSIDVVLKPVNKESDTFKDSLGLNDSIDVIFKTVNKLNIKFIDALNINDTALVVLEDRDGNVKVNEIDNIKIEEAFILLFENIINDRDSIIDENKINDDVIINFKTVLNSIKLKIIDSISISDGVIIIFEEAD